MWVNSPKYHHYSYNFSSFQLVLFVLSNICLSCINISLYIFDCFHSFNIVISSFFVVTYFIFGIII